MNSLTDTAMTEESIADYLQENPDFFERHAEMLTGVRLISGHGPRAVSLQERQAEMLREKIKGLEHRIMDMMRHGSENAAIASKIHQWTHALVKVQDLRELPHALTASLQHTFDVPQVALRLWNVAGAHSGTVYTMGVSDDAKAFAKALKSDGSNFTALCSAYASSDFYKKAYKAAGYSTQLDVTKTTLKNVVATPASLLALDPDYVQAVRKLCDEKDLVLIVDEVQTGVGRTGTFLCCEHYNLKPDIVTLAKGLAGGVPIGACVTAGKAKGLFGPGNHGSTFGGNPLACRVACTVLGIMERDGMAQRAALLGERLLAGLRLALAGHPGVQAIRGLGLMAGIELKRNCQELVGRALAEQRLLITVTRERTIRLLPPLICDEAQIDDIVARVASLCRDSGASHQAV